MPPHKHHHHHGHHGHGIPPFVWGGGYPGWWDYPRSELVVVDQADKSRDKILAYIASLPEKDRAKAFTKFFGSTAGDLAGFIDELTGPKSFVIFGLGALAVYWLAVRKKNPGRRRRARYRRHRRGRR